MFRVFVVVRMTPTSPVTVCLIVKIREQICSPHGSITGTAGSGATLIKVYANSKCLIYTAWKGQFIIASVFNFSGEIICVAACVRRLLPSVAHAILDRVLKFAVYLN